MMKKSVIELEKRQFICLTFLVSRGFRFGWPVMLYMDDIPNKKKLQNGKHLMILTLICQPLSSIHYATL